MSKKTILLSLVLFVLICITSTNLIVRAHSPSNMTLVYNINSNELSVTINHNVGDPNTHFIDTVIIRVNGSIVDTLFYSSQPNPSSFTYIYNVTANFGAAIQVTAECNQGGSITRSITVGSSTPGEIIPGFTYFILITLIVTVLTTLIVYRTKKVK